MNNQSVNNIPNQTVQGPVAQPTIQPIAQNTVQNTVPVQPQMATQPVNNKKTKKSKSGIVIILLFIIILGLAGGCYYFYDKNNQTIDYYKNYYSPVTADEMTKLDLDSTIVKDLYATFGTTVEEDFFAKDYSSNTMKLYIALKNVNVRDYLNSNCNMYDNTKLQHFTCSGSFTPKAIDEDVIKLKLKQLYGDNNNIELTDVQLANSCYGGYQYISGRKQFVQGKCVGDVECLVQAEKELISATSTKNGVELREKVRYYSTNITVPDYLKSGIYIYKFRLDNNYNYVLMSKELSEERG